MREKPAGGALVLVVDDEPLIRMATVSSLEGFGCTTLEAGGAEEALSMLEANPRVKVLFTDINMPGPMDGLDLARRVRRDWPHIVVILSSGRGTSHTNLPDGAMYVPKPYFEDDLQQIANKARC